jgi:hypothetical protein
MSIADDYTAINQAMAPTAADGPPTALDIAAYLRVYDRLGVPKDPQVASVRLWLIKQAHYCLTP